MSTVELKGLKELGNLDSLLATSRSESFSKENFFNLPIDLLIPGKYQPRTHFDESSLEELVDSIKAQGIITPLLVRRQEAGHFEIIAGERRWRAAKLAQLKTVPAIIRDVSDNTALAFALIENIQREALNPIDEALAFMRLKDEFSMTHEQIAERVGKSRSAVTNLMRLLMLHDEVKDLLKSGKIEMGHARALLALDNVAQGEAAHRILSNNLSVRETEKLVQRMKAPASQRPAAPYEFEERISKWEKMLAEKLSSSVKVALNSKGEGRVIINVHSPEEVEWLVDNIKME